MNSGTSTEAQLTSQRITPRTDSAGTLLRLIRTGQASTRSELGALTGLARSTVAQRVELLMAAGLICEIGDAPSTGGRPPSTLGFNPDAGVVLVADLGATHSTLALCGVDGQPIDEVSEDMAIDEGPETVLQWVVDRFDQLLHRAGRSAAQVRGVAIGLPGPVDSARGEAVNPPIMPGWNRVPVRPLFAQRYDAPVLVDNDVNLMALGEHSALEKPPEDFLFVKVGTGIGSGLIMSGNLHRGSLGAAGDLGHVQVGPSDVLCACGNHGCLEASAGGGALARNLASIGLEAKGSRDVVKLVRNGNRQAISAVRDAGRLIGGVLATTVNLLNPSMIVIGGDVAMADEHLLAGAREIVYTRATTLATTELIIKTGALGDTAGIRGGAAMVVDHAFSPVNVDAKLGRSLAV
jgi:predicted NBD/HSP70 family sugar kinase